MPEGMPLLQVGQPILLFGRRDRNQTLVLMGGQGSLYMAHNTDSSAIATDAEGNPVAEWNCPEGAVIARPLDQAPADSTVTSSDRIFVANPSESGMMWSKFSDEMNACVRTVRAGRQP